MLTRTDNAGLAEVGARPPSLFRDRNFRWLFCGGALSMLGDQFTLIALPWLVLHLTNDSLALGATLAAISLPRAVLVLFGGALVDRYSPRRMLIISKCCSALMTVLLALVALQPEPDVRQIYALAFGLGLSGALGFPASAALLPHIVSGAHLGQANSLLMGMNQVSALLGPVGAGLLISTLAPGAASVDGIGIAFLFDALSFVASVWTLSLIVPRAAPAPADAAGRPGNLVAQIGYALVYFWKDRSLRACCLYWSAIAFCVGGPVQVAIPVLAMNSLSEGAAALGMIVSAHGAGAVSGMIFANVTPRLRQWRLGAAILAVDAVIGLLFIPMGYTHHAWQASILLFFIGGCNGFIQIRIYTWVQRRIPRELLGRAMSLFMCMLMSVAPLSVLCSGFALRILSVEHIFIASGVLLIGVAGAAAGFSRIAQLSDRAGPADD